ncbi:hypothetical protein K466DRAFT_372525 [Polyporus arcularius HHB13444]|uniref:Uncharacterized protein n=1 Tax=Polyporus arcularius HHB13444 TaxID=1314778 RepID=A0A5C3PNK6_9APHY|nr:hypothetical protein K466DRAFT_372525 [Polyporus arcularius HHB13444]
MRYDSTRASQQRDEDRGARAALRSPWYPASSSGACSCYEAVSLVLCCLEVSLPQLSHYVTTHCSSADLLSPDRASSEFWTCNCDRWHRVRRSQVAGKLHSPTRPSPKATNHIRPRPCGCGSWTRAARNADHHAFARLHCPASSYTVWLVRNG